MSRKNKDGSLPRLDPELKKAVLQWEEQAAAAWTRMLRDPLFLRQMWRTVEGTFQTQQLITDQLARYAESLQFPSRALQEELEEALHRLEEHLADLDAQVDGLLGDEQK